MKKLFIALLLGATTLTTFAANWNATKLEDLKVTENDTKDLVGKIRVECAKALIDKTTTNMSYAEYKEIIKKTTLNVVNNTTDASAASKNFYIKHPLYVAPIFAVWMNRFANFRENIIKDPEMQFSTFMQTIYYQYSFKEINLTVEERRAGIVKGMEKFSDSLYQVKKFWNAYKGIYVKLDSKVTLADLKLFKKMFYMNIQKSDEWKVLLVEIELMLKSVQ